MGSDSPICPNSVTLIKFCEKSSNIKQLQHQSPCGYKGDMLEYCSSYCCKNVVEMKEDYDL